MKKTKVKQFVIYEHCIKSLHDYILKSVSKNLSINNNDLSI